MQMFSKADTQPEPPSDTPIAQPVIRLPTIEEWASHDRRDPEGEGEEYRRVVLPFVDSSLRLGRHLDRAVVLLLGETGHGKTKTINRLIGSNLLEVAQRCAGSTTKAVQRVNVSITVDSNGDLIGLTVSFDDTPGFGDTITNDRGRNQALLDKYTKERFPKLDKQHFPKLDESLRIYPNVILIVASWDSVKEDDNDNPDHFTSSIGKTIQYLSRSKLVDTKRGNVIAVVTKSLSFSNDYEDFGSQNEKDAAWREDADAKRHIINYRRSRAFESTGHNPDWPVVFVENGGGTSAKPRSLPNGETYPENLFDAIKNMVSLAGPDESQDLVGTAALEYLTGASGHTEILVETRSSSPKGRLGWLKKRPTSNRSDSIDNCSITSEVLEDGSNIRSLDEVLNGSSSILQALPTNNPPIPRSSFDSSGSSMQTPSRVNIATLWRRIRLDEVRMSLTNGVQKFWDRFASNSRQHNRRSSGRSNLLRRTLFSF